MAALPHAILLLDDEERIRQLLILFLEDFEEFSARGAASGEEALEELARAPADLCVVDMRLPGMNGQEFILAARERGLCGRFILHTGSLDYLLPEELARLGLTGRDVFLKPCDMRALLARIRQLLDHPGT